MKVNKETLLQIAHLSRLHLETSEEAALIQDLNKILDWVDKLKELDTDQVEPLRHMSEAINQLRPDKAQMSLSREKALQLAPSHNDAYFKVPKVIDPTD